jgi:hypothetical protein
LHCNKIAVVDAAEINVGINEESAIYCVPDVRHIFAKFGGLAQLLDVMNSDGSMVEESYAFVAAFWFKSVMLASVRNAGERAFRVIRDNLEMAFAKVAHRAACGKAFQKMELDDLFPALAKGDMVELSSYLLQFYDKKNFTVPYLKAKIQKKAQGDGKVCVAIPVYAEQPRPLERACLRRCLDVLGKQRIIFFGPESLNMAAYASLAREYGAAYTIERFPDVYFTSPSTYLSVEKLSKIFDHAFAARSE